MAILAIRIFLIAEAYDGGLWITRSRGRAPVVSRENRPHSRRFPCRDPDLRVVAVLQLLQRASPAASSRLSCPAPRCDPGVHHCHRQPLAELRTAPELPNSRIPRPKDRRPDQRPASYRIAISLRLMPSFARHPGHSRFPESTSSRHSNPSKTISPPYRASEKTHSVDERVNTTSDGLACYQPRKHG
jgi:hypothetical protein